ncbi:MAG: helix-hairpin-helix domain-containing protein [Candidatus Odinarchaeum yellowstonii]|uniref:Helix-hairpin-helix domain-containing protein n=1 Tax=Odinarchaeota yellowstonii (strain LCB_4) TaxID=1841599 RepID=A0AAF0D2H0_ODILC|nr:MAG: helix-hairpin-helix domain-containing protein [Candidatus Odinarchaeum yellowstonii]
MAENKTPLSEVKGISKKTIEALNKAGITTIGELSRYSLDELQNKIPDLSKTTLKRLIDKINELKTQTEPVKKPVEKTRTEKTRAAKVSAEKTGEKAKPVKEEKPKKEIKSERIKKPSETVKYKIPVKPSEPIRRAIGKVYSFERGGARISNNKVLAHIIDSSKKVEELIGVKVWLKYGKNLVVKGKIINKHGNASNVKIKLDKPVSAAVLNAPIYL